MDYKNIFLVSIFLKLVLKIYIVVFVFQQTPPPLYKMYTIDKMASVHVSSKTRKQKLTQSQIKQQLATRIDKQTIFQDSKCLLPSNDFCMTLDIGASILVLCYMIDGTIVSMDSKDLLRRLRSRKHGNNLRVHGKDHFTCMAETSAIIAMLKSMCVGDTFDIKPMQIHAHMFDLWGQDIVAFNVAGNFYTVYPPSSINLDQLLKMNASGNEYYIDEKRANKLMSNIMETLKYLSEISHVHFQVSLKSIYYSVEHDRFYLGHWEHLRHTIGARKLFYKENSRLSGYERTDILRTNKSRSRHGLSITVGCMYNSPLQKPDLQTIFMNPYIKCLDDSVKEKYELLQCLSKKVANNGLHNANLKKSYYVNLIATTKDEYLADHLSANLMSCLDLYSFMVVIHGLIQTHGIVLPNKVVNIMERTLSPFHENPFVSFAEAYEIWKHGNVQVRSYK